MGIKQFEKKRSKRNDVDEELRRIVEENKTKIKVAGAGGAGGNTITRLMDVGIIGAETIAINTDAMDLLCTRADRKVLIGKNITRGLGAGANPEVGMEAARESREEIKDAFGKIDMVFLTCGLGGGCLRGSSLILTNPDGPVRIDSIKPGSIVYTFSNGSLVKRKVLAAMKTGVKKVLELKTRNRTIYASEDHPFLRVKLNVSSEGRFSKFTLEWIELRNLKVGDLVVILRETPDDEKPLQFSNRGDMDEKFCQLPEFFKYFGFNRVKSIKEIGYEEVYDITVEGTHNFIAEGFVVHNTGTGSLPVIAEIAKGLNALVVGVVTLPFSMEGKERMKNAREGIEKLEKLVDTLIVIPNDRLLEICPEANLGTAFRICDELLINAVKGIAELITKPGLINRDFADVKAVMTNGGLAMMGLGESNSEKRAIESVEKAIKNPLLTVDINDATGVLIHIMSGPELKVSEAREIVEGVSSKLSPRAKILWGATIDEKLGDVIKTMLIVTGVKSPQIFGPDGFLPKQKRKDVEKVLDIKFVE